MREGSDPCGTRTTVHLRFAMLITSCRGWPATSAHRLLARSRPDAEAALNLVPGTGGVKHGFLCLSLSLSKTFVTCSPGKRNWLAGTALASGGTGKEVFRLGGPCTCKTGGVERRPIG